MKQLSSQATISKTALQWSTLCNTALTKDLKSHFHSVCTEGFWKMCIITVTYTASLWKAVQKKTYW